MSTIYATGNYSHSVLAKWLNGRGHRTTRGNLFCSDTVRDMMGNLSYAGFVTAQRSTSREIKAKHQPIVTEELFDRCAELRRQRTTTKPPGRPSQRFVLKSIARCERCQGRMYGQNTGRKGMPRYYCSTRRKREGCDQPLAPAVPIEQQLADFVSAFTPSTELRDEIMARLVIDEPADAHTDRQRRTLKERRKRLRDLYEMGDIEKAEYRAKCAEIDETLDSMAPAPTADLDGARAVLEDFGRFWEAEADPVKRRELVAQLFERVWIDESRIVAVRPTKAFAPFFERRPGGRGHRPTNDNAAPQRSGEVETTGATGVKPALCTSKKSRSASDDSGADAGLCQRSSAARGPSLARTSRAGGFRRLAIVHAFVGRHGRGISSAASVGVSAQSRGRRQARKCSSSSALAVSTARLYPSAASRAASTTSGRIFAGVCTFGSSSPGLKNITSPPR